MSYNNADQRIRRGKNIHMWNGSCSRSYTQSIWKDTFTLERAGSRALGTLHGAIYDWVPRYRKQNSSCAPQMTIKIFCKQLHNITGDCCYCRSNLLIHWDEHGAYAEANGLALCMRSDKGTKSLIVGQQSFIANYPSIDESTQCKRITTMFLASIALLCSTGHRCQPCKSWYWGHFRCLDTAYI